MSPGWAFPGPCSGRNAPVGTRRAQKSGWLMAFRTLAALSAPHFPKLPAMPSSSFHTTPGSIRLARSAISSRRIRTASTAPVLGVPTGAHIHLIFRFRVREPWPSLQLLTVTKLTFLASGSPNFSKCTRDRVVPQLGSPSWSKMSLFQPSYPSMAPSAAPSIGLSSQLSFVPFPAHSCSICFAYRNVINTI